MHFSVLTDDYLGQQECNNGDIGIDIIICTLAPADLRIFDNIEDNKNAKFLTLTLTL